MARLRSIRIAGWKSIQDINPKLELDSINVLIGANGAGKSNFVSFFKLLNELVNERLQTYIAQLGGASSVLHYGPKVSRAVTIAIALELEIGPDREPCTYTVYLSNTDVDSLTFLDEKLESIDSGQPGHSTILNVAGKKESLLKWTVEQFQGPSLKIVLDHFKQYRVFHFHDTSVTASIRRPGYIEANQGLYSDGGNLAAMLYLYQQTKPDVYRRIVATVRHVMPRFDDFVLGPQLLNPRNILLNWKQKGTEHVFGPHQLSDGTLRAMALIALFLQPGEDLPTMIVVDEPELGLHPHAIVIIAGLIRAASLKAQVILTTQSTTFLDHFEPEEIIVVDVRQGHSLFRHLETEELKYWLKDYSIGRLWEKNVLDGGPLS